MTTALPRPTPELRTLAQALGLDGLLRLLERRAGTRLPIPVKVGASGLVDELGADLTARLVEHWGGLSLKVPLGRAWRVQVYHARGASYAEIATSVGLTEDGVWRILKTSGLTNGGARRSPRDEASDPPVQYDLLAFLAGDE